MSEVSDDLEVVITRLGSGVHVSVSGEVDVASSTVLRTALSTGLEGSSGDVDVDMSRITFCDSVGLCALLAARLDLQSRGRAMRLVNPAPCVIRLLEVTATSELFSTTSGGAR